MRFWLAIFTLILSAGIVLAQVDPAPKVQARLVAESSGIGPGKTITVALEQNIRPGWHTYWRNPGEAGLPTEVTWSLPAGWKAGPIQWPYPRRLPVGPLMNYGYEGKVWLLTSITAPPNAAPGNVVLKATGSWLVCKEVCIPEDQALRLTVNVSAAPPAPYATVAEQFAAARARIPVPSPWPVTFQLRKTLDLFIASPALAKAQIRDVAFFPAAAGAITDMAPQPFAQSPGGLVVHLQPARKPRLGKSLSGVVVITSADRSVQALNVSASLGAVPDISTTSLQDAGSVSLPIALLFALVGGLILNLMPCVLPVLAMKALAIANSAHGDRRAAGREGLSYGAGAILSFAALGLAIILLRASGQAIGWGFQLQSPIAVAAFALLIFIVGLNLSGLFEVPGIGAGEELTRRGGAVGAFFTGVLAVAVAAPCTAPFMAAALGYALTQSTATSLAIFLALGIGFAAPFVLIGLSPAITRWLPKPGAWMVRFRQLLAFPMYATALWLFWVLSFETDQTHTLLLLILALLTSFALWLFGVAQAKGDRWRPVSWLAVLGGLAVAAYLLPQIGGGATAAHPVAAIEGMQTRPYNSAAVEAARRRGQPVFVNATAAWCITCLVNEKVAFSDPQVQSRFRNGHIAYFVADWTNRDPAITALLQAHGRSGVPLYLYYAHGASTPAVLPQVLTPAAVLGAIDPK